MEVYFLKIRRQILKTLFIFVFGSVFGMIFYQKILGIIFSFFNFRQTSLILTSPGQTVSLILSIGFFAGVLISFPFFIFYLLNFFKPALTSKEYQLLTSLIFPSFFLLLLGLIYGFYIMRVVILVYGSIPLGIKIQRLWNLEEFLSQMVFLSAAMGILFQLPIGISISLRLRWISKNKLASKRKIIYSLLLILAVLLPPTDPLSLAILVLPLIIMFEGALLLN